MLYELTATDSSGNYQTAIVEAPESRTIPHALENWIVKTWLPSMGATEGAVAAFRPTRIGYKGANTYGVSETAQTCHIGTVCR